MTSRRLPFAALALLAVVSLSACTSTQDVLEPSAIAAQQQADGSAIASTVTSSVTASSDATAPTRPIAQNIRMQIAPIVGPSVDAAAPLTERLALKARERGIRLAGSTDTAPTTHVLKGYFSALTEGKETTVVYVWDVYDPDGNRLHRINGQQKAATSGTEGWGAVPPAAMQAIADSTVSELASWLSGQTG